jgi:hypothetical protein
MKDAESHQPVHATNWLWPPLGMPPGLYREVVGCKYKFFVLFHFISALRFVLMVAQLLIGAALTALGAMSPENGKRITILGAVNTATAGFLALLHNSGLPDRYRNDMAEFEKIEDHIKEVLNSNICPAGQTADQFLAECFDLYRDAKSTVALNMPASYASKQTFTSKGKNKVVEGDLQTAKPQPITPNRSAEGSQSARHSD